MGKGLQIIIMCSKQGKLDELGKKKRRAPLCLVP